MPFSFYLYFTTISICMFQTLYVIIVILSYLDPWMIFSYILKTVPLLIDLIKVSTTYALCVVITSLLEKM
jgi:hypothetical protein